MSGRNVEPWYRSDRNSCRRCTFSDNRPRWTILIRLYGVISIGESFPIGKNIFTFVNNLIHLKRQFCACCTFEGATFTRSLLVHLFSFSYVHKSIRGSFWTFSTFWRSVPFIASFLRGILLEVYFYTWRQVFCISLLVSFSWRCTFIALYLIYFIWLILVYLSLYPFFLCLAHFLFMGLSSLLYRVIFRPLFLNLYCSLCILVGEFLFKSLFNHYVFAPRHMLSIFCIPVTLVRHFCLLLFITTYMHMVLVVFLGISDLCRPQLFHINIFVRILWIFQWFFKSNICRCSKMRV